MDGPSKVRYFVPNQFDKTVGTVHEYGDTTNTDYVIDTESWLNLRIVGSDGPEPVEFAEGRWAVIDKGKVLEDHMPDAQTCVRYVESLRGPRLTGRKLLGSTHHHPMTTDGQTICGILPDFHDEFARSTALPICELCAEGTNR